LGHSLQVSAAFIYTWQTLFVVTSTWFMSSQVVQSRSF